MGGRGGGSTRSLSRGTRTISNTTATNRKLGGGITDLGRGKLAFDGKRVTNKTLDVLENNPHKLVNIGNDQVEFTGGDGSFISDNKFLLIRNKGKGYTSSFTRNQKKQLIDYLNKRSLGGK